MALFALPCLLVAAFEPLRAQVGPVDHDGYLEYQYRLITSEDLASSTLHLATWRTRASTYVWQPYILVVDGSLGLTRARNDFGSQASTNSIVTGALAANVFARSRFPFRAYFESRDSRVDGDVFDVDLVTHNWGFLQQFSPRGGGRLAVDYRQSTSEELRVDGFRDGRDFSSRTWQINGTKSTKRNDFDLLTSLRDLSRDQPMQMENRRLFNLRHRFRTSPNFFIEDTTFYSDEDIDFGHVAGYAPILPVQRQQQLASKDKEAATGHRPCNCAGHRLGAVRKRGGVGERSPEHFGELPVFTEHHDRRELHREEHRYGRDS